MAHQWTAGVLNASSWHGLEEVGDMPDAAAAIEAAERTDAWPVAIEAESLTTASGLRVKARSMVASYRSGQRRAFEPIGNRYHATTPEDWRSLVHAATLAGGKPTGVFALREGSRVLATFEVGQSNGLRQNLIIADAFDGTMRLMCGLTLIRVVCANTMGMWLETDGEAAAAIRHTASLDTKVAALRESIGHALTAGGKVRDLYEAASQRELSNREAYAVLDALFPPAAEDAPKVTQTKVANLRAEVARAAERPENYAGQTLATLWNAATYLVDRNADGTSKEPRSGERLDSMLFGARAKRVQDVQTIIEVILRDGTTQAMQASEAIAAGAAEPGVIGAKVLEDILADM